VPTATPTPKVKAPEAPLAPAEEVPSILEEIVEKVKEILEKAIPEVSAAAPAEEEAEVLGVTRLPITAIGEMGPGISLIETLLGFALIGMGARLKKLLKDEDMDEPEKICCQEF